MSEAVLRPGRAGDEAVLSELALRSKGHWGYPPEFLEACRAELTVRPDQITDVVVAEVAGVVAGFRLLVSDGVAAELDALFVDPPFIGAGIGGVLLAEVLATARERGIQVVGLDADPGAESFYAKYGARTVGVTPSGSIPGRELPRLEFDLRA